MYSLLRNEPLRKQFAADAKTLLTTQALTLLPALLITQLFYHWKSFLLEFGGFHAQKSFRYPGKPFCGVGHVKMVEVVAQTPLF